MGGINQKNTMAATNQTVERYRKIFEYSNDAILFTDIEADSFVDVNPAACRLLGYSYDDFSH